VEHAYKQNLLDNIILRIAIYIHRAPQSWPKRILKKYSHSTIV